MLDTKIVLRAESPLPSHTKNRFVVSILLLVPVVSLVNEGPAGRFASFQMENKSIFWRMPPAQRQSSRARLLVQTGEGGRHGFAARLTTALPSKSGIIVKLPDLEL